MQNPDIHDVNINFDNYIIKELLDINLNIINDNLDLRIKYMMHELTDEKYKQLLQSREKQNEKNHEFDMIFRTYVVAARDIILNFVNLPDKNNKIERQPYVYTELTNLRNYINECFQRLIPVFNNYVWNITKYKDRFKVEKIKS